MAQTLASLTQWIEDSDAINLILVENLGRGDCFEFLEGSEVYTRALGNHVQIVKLDQLQPGLVKKVDFSNTSFWAAANNRQLMSTVERHRVGTWLKKQYVQLDRVLQPMTWRNTPLQSAMTGFTR